MIEPGIHFGLSEDAYHGDPALGSTDIRKLLASGPDYWWTSTMNPMRAEREVTDALTFGRALHKLVLEGQQAFDALYQREDDGPAVLRSDADLSAWLSEFGQTKLPRSKADKIKLIQQVAGLMEADVPVMHDEVVRLAKEAGREILKAADYDRMLIAGALITKNPELATAFEGGMPEVSVFWTTADGLRLKCRFDYLKPFGIGDLKSIRNSRGVQFVEACRRAIADHRYDIQAAHYLEGRAQLVSLAAAGRVFGDHDAAWLARVAGADEYGFAWVFFQATEAPITWATSISPGNPILDVAAASIAKALDTYRTFMAEFGPDRMWVLADPVNELDMSELPAWWARAA